MCTIVVVLNPSSMNCRMSLTYIGIYLHLLVRIWNWLN